jgi:diaminohydroxyphosphoribosylaminopyrimidine deaminase/5-amino-6-(5-phosphoribosylamino)uracil reductase
VKVRMRGACSRPPGRWWSGDVGVGGAKAHRPNGAKVHLACSLMLCPPEPDCLEETGVAGKASTTEHEAMARAISLARTDAVRTHPNPRVGAVLLDASGAEIGSGLHRGAGNPHAEVEALARVGDLARGATAIVTLEPCNHTGRTGPCSEALIDAGVARVVFGQPDPNPLARGGADALAAAGVEVIGGVLAEESRLLNPVWSFAMEHQRPLVTWKFAATLDGRVAAVDNTSRWISGAQSRAEVHQLRTEVDAVVVGTGTVLADDPQLTARDKNDVQSPRQPLRVVVGEGDVPLNARVLDASADTLLCATHEVGTVLDDLFARDVHQVLLEGGPTLVAAFVRADLVDRVVGYVGPRLLGAGPSVIGTLDIDTISDARELTIDDVCLVGGDIRWTARLHRSAPRFLPPDVAVARTEGNA